jgi:hypothetical protein
MTPVAAGFINEKALMALAEDIGVVSPPPFPPQAASRTTRDAIRIITAVNLFMQRLLLLQIKR